MKDATMKAIVRQIYGSPDVLELQEVEKPTPKDDEVLIKVHAVSINSSDYEFLTGTPSYIRMWGFFKPRHKILGSDIAGRVEAVGKNIKALQVGDDIFGDVFERWGGFAEYVCAPEKKLVLKPAGMTFAEVAAIPQAGVLAHQGLRDKGKIQSGQKVLINGAGGGSGTFAIQLAKMYGAEVTAVDTGAKFDLMRSLGADHVIDYTKEDFTRNGQKYDLVFDATLRRSVFSCMRSLAPNGRYVIAGGTMGGILQAVFVGALLSMVSNKRVGLVIHIQNQKEMGLMADLFEEGKVKPIIDRHYPLNETPEALRYFGKGLQLGKIVITM